MRDNKYRVFSRKITSLKESKKLGKITDYSKILMDL